MYKCTECGLEYKVKPDYCDCGNNDFVLTIENNELGQNPSNDLNSANQAPDIKEEPGFNKNIPTTLDSSFKMNVDIFSIAVFICCLVSAYAIIFIWNPINQNIEENSDVQKITAPQAYIPNINELWKEPQIKNTEKPLPAQELAKKQTTTPKVQTIVKKNATPKQTNNTTKSIQTSFTPKLTTKSSSVNQQTIAQKQNSSVNLNIQKSNLDTTKAEAEAEIAAEKARKLAIEKQEYYTYKINLRNSIAKKIDFTKVIGDGSCVVSFKIDSLGNLTNKAFAKQSSNLTLNNAVYKAIMATPNFTQPPTAYKNETLQLNISFNNGNYTITLD